MSAPFAILGIDHVVLRAADPAGLERFYVEVLGCSFERRQGALTQLRAGNALIDIVPAGELGPAGGTSRSGGANLDHLCLRVDPFDAAAIARHLAAHGAACGAEASR
jgi:glyoxylase I family protein